MAGYSGKPLVDKLGIKAGARLGVFDAPDGFDATLGKLPDKVTRSTTLRGDHDVAVLFAKNEKGLAKRFDQVAKAMTENGSLWVSWPKKSSGIPSDLDENIVRGVGLARGWVDVKVCAVDQVWSGLKFVIRIANRKK